MRSLNFAFVLAMTVSVGCNPYDPDLGEVPFKCGMTEPRCPEGFACKDDGMGNQQCVTTTGVVPDAGPTGLPRPQAGPLARWPAAQRPGAARVCNRMRRPTGAIVNDSCSRGSWPPGAATSAMSKRPSSVAIAIFISSSAR